MQRYSGRRLKAARIIANLTRAQLAEKVGVHTDTVAHWERGHHPPNADRLALVAHITGTPITAFFDVVEEVA